jgi:hypothetical protein
LLHQVGDLFELNVKRRCQKVNTIWPPEDEQDIVRNMYM